MPEFDKKGNIVQGRQVGGAKKPPLKHPGSIKSANRFQHEETKSALVQN